ncbi:response regulator [Paenibacillus puerhi]|uniref:response regulator n=1 Tax=Paenibacillus puerhi TaxID=2692622 RepID=UPI00135B2C53|nr:response regulator [Paenibacillus puerhi]
MYKLIIVEDEEDVRLGMVEEIDWASHGFEVKDTGENGKDAIELIERWAPDVVVTDIRMPFMDGLQLAEWIREHYPSTRILILTGFDEFEYAQKAIRLQIDEYVLKPFSAEELIAAMLKVKAQMDEEAERRKDMLTLQDYYRKSLPVLREVFLASLVTRKLPGRQIEEQCAHYQLDLKASAYTVAAVRIDKPEENGPGEHTRESLRYSKDEELRAFAALNVVGEVLSRHDAGLAFLHNGLLVIVALHREPVTGSVWQRLLAVLEEIRLCVDKYLKITVTIGIGTVCDELTELSHAFNDAVLALDYRLLLGGNRLICISDVETRFAEKLRFDELKEQALVRCLKVGTGAEIQETVDGLFEGIGDNQVSVKDYQVYLMEILTVILKAAKDAQADMETIFGPEFAPLAELNSCTELSEAKGWILGLCMRLAQGIASGRQCANRSLVEKAKAYTLEHYPDSGLSIAKVCSQLHISAGYFSSVFKKEAKVTFGAYLLTIRMEAAKELLRTTDLKAFEIAERVGYAEPNYFSFSFRKAVGVSPKEYRSAAGRGDL